MKILKKEMKIVMIRIHSCLNKTYYLPGRRPLECEVNKEKRDTYNVKCCSTDFCNNDKTLTLERNRPGGICCSFCLKTFQQLKTLFFFFYLSTFIIM